MHYSATSTVQYSLAGISTTVERIMAPFTNECPRVGHRLKCENAALDFGHDKLITVRFVVDQLLPEPLPLEQKTTTSHCHSVGLCHG